MPQLALWEPSSHCTAVDTLKGGVRLFLIHLFECYAQMLLKLIKCLVFSHARCMALDRVMLVCWWVHHFSPDLNISTTIAWIGIKFCTDFHGSQRMNPNDFGDPMTFPLVPP